MSLVSINMQQKVLA